MSQFVDVNLFALKGARLHFVENMCAKEFHPKANPYKFHFDADSGQFKCG